MDFTQSVSLEAQSALFAPPGGGKTEDADRGSGGQQHELGRSPGPVEKRAVRHLSQRLGTHGKGYRQRHDLAGQPLRSPLLYL